MTKLQELKAVYDAAAYSAYAACDAADAAADAAYTAYTAYHDELTKVREENSND
jgi:hypothetical protein